MKNMTTFLAGQPFERISQIDPDQLHTMEDVIAALRAIHDELNVKDPVSVLIKTELQLFAQILDRFSSSYQIVKLGILMAFSGRNVNLDIPEIKIEKMTGVVGSLSYLLSAHAMWEISAENKNEIVLLLEAADKFKSILVQFSKNPTQYMCKLIQLGCRYEPKVKSLTEDNIWEITDDIIFPGMDGAKLLLPRRLEFFDAVQDFDPDREPSEPRVIEALNNIVAVLDICFEHLKIRKMESRNYGPEGERLADEGREKEVSQDLGISVEEVREFFAQVKASKEFEDPRYLTTDDMSTCIRIDDPILQQFMTNVLQNVTLCLSLKLLMSKNQEYAFSGTLLGHINLVIDKVNANHTVQGKQAVYNVPTKHGEYRAWLEKSNLPLQSNKDLKRWDGVEVGRVVKPSMLV
jgi:hypothetical protein